MIADADFPLLFERSRQGRIGYRFPPSDLPRPVAGDGRPVSDDSVALHIPAPLRRGSAPALPSLSEVEVVRHYVALSRRTYGVDLGFYPLGSCTMKYNPKIDEAVAALPGFTAAHPLQPTRGLQGLLELLFDLTERLCVITGMDAGTLQPFAGAHGEFTGMKLFRAYFAQRGESRRAKILVPDSAHGTNPASAHLAGFEVVELRSNRNGVIALEEVRPHLDDRLAGIMLTNPNTLGLFETEILPIAQAVHGAGGLLYYDGANLNAIMGRARPGDMGFDVVHLNLHKTFGTPHGGGGPGAGPVLVRQGLARYLPVPVIVRDGEGYRLDTDRPDSIGRVAGFFGNVGVLIRAYAYLLLLGADGLAAAAERAVLNANYLKRRLSPLFDLPYDGLCKHELVLSARSLKEATGVSALDIAKRLLDYGVHPPTIYFPLIVAEALMIEPTESESKEGLDAFVDIMREIARDARDRPELVKGAPTQTPVQRVDEVLAARKPILRYKGFVHG